MPASPEAQATIQAFLNEQSPATADELATFLRLVDKAGFGREPYQDVIDKLVEIQPRIRAIDMVVAAGIPQDIGYIQAVLDRLTGERQYIAHLAGEFLGELKVAAKRFWFSKESFKAAKSDDTRETRMAYQDGGQAPFEFLAKTYEERVKTLDKVLTRANRMSERENILLNRGAAGTNHG